MYWISTQTLPQKNKSLLNLHCKHLPTNDPKKKVIIHCYIAIFFSIVPLTNLETFVNIFIYYVTNEQNIPCVSVVWIKLTFPHGSGRNSEIPGVATASSCCRFTSPITWQATVSKATRNVAM